MNKISTKKVQNSNNLCHFGPSVTASTKHYKTLGRFLIWKNTSYFPPPPYQTHINIYNTHNFGEEKKSYLTYV